jgi:phosphatidylglycerophosphatase A
MAMQALPGIPGLGGGEIILILVLVLILFGARLLPEFFNGFLHGIQEFKKACKEVSDAMTTQMREDQNSKEFPERTDRESSKLIAAFILWIAQGFGAGKIPWGPGTFGSVVGLFWFAALVAGGSFWLYLIGCVVGIVVSVRFCGLAEIIMGERDPSSVVLDEIIAIPICFAGWVCLVYFKGGYMPEVTYFFSKQTWPVTAAIFALFRLFDIAKPPPVYRSQSLPGGWGVTMDDVLAAVYVNVVVLGVHMINSLLTHKS